MSRSLWITGLALMVSPLILSTLLFAGAEGWDAIVGAAIFTFVLGPILFIVGLVLLIVGASRGGQQQQQQVVVYTQGAAQHCTGCGVGMEVGQRFCAGCGVGV